MVGCARPADQPPRGEPPATAAVELEILVAARDQHLGRVVALLSDGRGLAQREDRTIVVVDPRTGVELEPHAAPVPTAEDCELRRWGTHPALICDVDALYRLGPSGWQLITRAQTDHHDVVVLADDGVHASYVSGRCPGEPPPPPGPLARWATCVFTPAGWRHAPEPSVHAVAVAMHGSRLALHRYDPETRRDHLIWVDAGTLAMTREELPTYAGRELVWSAGIAPEMQPADGTVILDAHPRLTDAGGAEVDAAGVLAVRSPAGAWTTSATTSAPRERWGVNVAFADARHGVAAGSFYRHVYYTVDGGAHWTTIAGLDPARDARFGDARMMEDSTMDVSCDATRACRVGLHPDVLVVRFARRL